MTHLNQIGNFCVDECARSAVRSRPEPVPDALTLVFQPIVRCCDGSIAAVEALARFPRANGSLRPTVATIDRIYASRQGFAFDRRVLGAAIAEGRRWLARGIDVGMHVNISAETVESKHGWFGEWLANGHDAAPRLTLELTERDTFDDFGRAGNLLTSCRRPGVELAIDDFGCGYSTFELLHDVPADVVKIDCAFTARLPGSDRTGRIVRSLIVLAHELEMRVVAEGVETREQCAWLCEAGCDELQGFYFARPMSGDDYLSWHRSFDGASMRAR